METLNQETEPLPSAEVYLEQQEVNKQNMKGNSICFVSNRPYSLVVAILNIVIHATKFAFNLFNSKEHVVADKAERFIKSNFLHLHTLSVKEKLREVTLECIFKSKSVL